MQLACRKLIGASRTFGLGRASASGRASSLACDCKLVHAPWRRRQPSSLRRAHSNAATSPNPATEEGGVSQTVKNEGPTTTIESEKDGEVSSLIRFESAIIRYPPSAHAAELDYGLDDDSSGIDGDLILESQESLQSNRRNEQPRLRRHWDQHSHQQQSKASNGCDSSKGNSHQHQLLFNNSFDLNVWPNLECGSGGGGHVVLGRNASGKTLLSRSLVHSLGRGSMMGNDNENDSYNHPSNVHESLENDNPFLQSGGLSMKRRNITKNRNHHFLSHVSFDSHSELLLDDKTTTVHRALIPSGGNRLSPTAKFLAVRLGMYPLLPRHVNTLSTGEIRRVLLVRALVSKPELLILDNAFDGLDVHGRKGLQDIIERVLAGFRMDILVQGVGDATDTARTQVMLLTHRPEEIADGMGRVTFMMDGADGGGVKLRTEDRMGRNGDELVRSLVSWEDQKMESLDPIDYGGVRDDNFIYSDAIPNHPWDIVSDDDFPSSADMKDFWEYGKSNEGDAVVSNDILIHAENLRVTRDDTTLLSHLDWIVQRGERWHLAGTNGAGKSTLSRLLLRTSMKNNQQSNSNTNKDDAVVSDGTLVVTPSTVASNARVRRGGISWVSTELHLHAAHNWGDRTVFEILAMGASFLFNGDKNDGPSDCDLGSSMDADIAVTATCWLGLVDEGVNRSDHDVTTHSFLSRKFSTLSQGEQKLLLIASAIAQRPSLLVLDEPCQGLDLWNRGHLLGLIERICRSTDMSLLYVTHHEEELIPSIGHRLCLDDGQVTYCGLR